MINKLPRWVEFGGFFLALNAGFINAVGLLGFKHQSVSHLTGASTFLGLEIAQMHWFEALHVLVVIISFLLGAAFSGVLIGNTALKLGRRYGLAMLIESGLLFAAMLLLVENSQSGHYLASAACGLQNAMTSTFSGAVVRTTHVSGLFTDLGVALGLRMRGHRMDRRKILLYTILINGFILGGVFGSLAFAKWQYRALALASLLMLIMALCYWLYRHQLVHAKKTQINEA